MGLETSTYISGLNASNPLNTDVKSQGDDHLRLIKTVLQATFPNAARAFRLPNAAASQTSAYSPAANVLDNMIIPCNASSGAFTVTLPASPGTDGMKAVVVKTDASVNAVTVAGNGNNINASADFVLNSQYSSVLLTWISSLSMWVGIGGASSALPTGAMMAYAATTAPGGWLRCNGRTIGSAASGAVERANADTLSLYTFLWTNYADAVCPVTGGRGASAAADFAADKPMGLPDLRGRSIFGLDNMGHSSASRLGSVITTATTNGSSGGTETVTLTSGQLPGHTHDAGTLATASGGDHTHFLLANQTVSNTGSPTNSNYLANRHNLSSGVEWSYQTGGSATTPTLALSSTNGAHTHTVTGATASAGSGEAHSNMPPAFLATWLIKM